MSNLETATAHRAWDERWRTEEGRAGYLEAEPEVRKVVDWLRANGGKRALDVGCGIGRHALYLDSISFQVCATDASEAGIAFAKEKAKKQCGLIDFQVAPMTELPFADRGFDYVVSWNVIYHGDGGVVSRAVSEIRRVLKPGGTFQGTMLSKRHSCFGQGREIAPDTWSSDVADEEKFHPHFYCSENELVSILDGFEITSLDEVEQDEPGDWHWHFITRAGHG